MWRGSFFSVSLLCLVSFITFLPGCYDKNFNEPGRIQVERKPTEMMADGGFQRTWSATQVVMAKFPVVKKDVDSASGRAYLVTDWVRGKSDLLFHGYGENRIPYVIRYKLFIYLLGDLRGEKTRVTIRSVEEYLDDVITSGVDVQGSVQNWIRTDSSTLKENALILQIQKLVTDPKFRGDLSQ